MHIFVDQENDPIGTTAGAKDRLRLLSAPCKFALWSEVGTNRCVISSPLGHVNGLVLPNILNGHEATDGSSFCIVFPLLGGSRLVTAFRTNMIEEQNHGVF